MGRLIDADELKDFFYYGKNDEPIFDENTDKKIVHIIDEWSTAYDSEKVVAQLEKLKKAEQDRTDDCDENGCGDGEQIYDDGRSQGRYEAFGEAIKIVKGGGVDG